MLEPIVQESHSVSEVLRKLGKRPSGGMNIFIGQHIREHGIDMSHFTGQRWSLGLDISDERIKKIARKNRYPDEEVFCENSKCARGGVKTRIIRRNLIEYKCNICRQEPKWQGKPIVLILDHINGIRNDHRLMNLQFVCPNCNSQLPTFAGKNIQEIDNNGNSIHRWFCQNCSKPIRKYAQYCTTCGYEKRKRQFMLLDSPNNFCPCGKRISHKAQACKSCAAKAHNAARRKVPYPPTTELVKEVKRTSYEAVGRRLGITGVAVKKWIKTHPE